MTLAAELTSGARRSAAGQSVMKYQRLGLVV